MLHGIVSEVPERAKKLAAAFWPGPLTMVMPRGPEVSEVTCAGLDTVGVRMPSHPVVQAVIKASGVAFAAPSANLSGKPSPTNAQDTFVAVSYTHLDVYKRQLLGIIENLSKAYISTQLSDAIVFVVLIVVLIVKPTGLLGKKVNVKV